MRHRTLYIATPFNRVVALDPVSGSTRWTFDPKLDTNWPYPQGFTSRGVAVWADAARSADTACAARVFLATVDARLIALDASRGVFYDDFGNNGTVHLARGGGIGGRDTSAVNLSVTSPPAIAGDANVVGSVVRENREGAASGAVRAFDARTGALRWAFDPIPRRPSDKAWSAWRPDEALSSVGANVWSVISVDPERD